MRQSRIRSLFSSRIPLAAALVLVAASLGGATCENDPYITVRIDLTISGSGTVGTLGPSGESHATGSSTPITFIGQGVKGMNYGVEAIPSLGWKLQSWGGACAAGGDLSDGDYSFIPLPATADGELDYQCSVTFVQMAADAGP